MLCSSSLRYVPNAPDSVCASVILHIRGRMLLCHLFFLKKREGSLQLQEKKIFMCVCKNFVIRVSISPYIFCYIEDSSSCAHKCPYPSSPVFFLVSIFVIVCVIIYLLDKGMLIHAFEAVLALWAIGLPCLTNLKDQIFRVL